MRKIFFIFFLLIFQIIGSNELRADFQLGPFNMGFNKITVTPDKKSLIRIRNYLDFEYNRICYLEIFNLNPHVFRKQVVLENFNLSEETQLIVSADSKFIAIYKPNNEILIIELADLRIINAIPVDENRGHYDDFYNEIDDYIQFSKNSKYFFMAVDEFSLVFKLSDFKLFKRLKNNWNKYKISADERLLVEYNNDTSMVWDFESGIYLNTFGSLQNLIFPDDNKYIYLIMRNILELRDRLSNEIISKKIFIKKIESSKLSKDNSKLLITTEDTIFFLNAMNFSILDTIVINKDKSYIGASENFKFVLMRKYNKNGFDTDIVGFQDRKYINTYSFVNGQGYTNSIDFFDIIEQNELIIIKYNLCNESVCGTELDDMAQSAWYDILDFNNMKSIINVGDLTFSPLGKYFCSKIDNLYFWKTQDSSYLGQIEKKVNKYDYSANDSLIAITVKTNSKSDSILIYSIPNLKIKYSLYSGEKNYSYISFIPKTNKIMVFDTSGKILIIDYISGFQEQEIPTALRTIKSVKYSDNGHIIALFIEKDTIIVMDITDNKILFDKHVSYQEKVSQSQDGKYLCFWDKATIYFYDLETMTVKNLNRNTGKEIYSDGIFRSNVEYIVQTSSYDMLGILQLSLISYDMKSNSVFFPENGYGISAFCNWSFKSISEDGSYISLVLNPENSSNIIISHLNDYSIPSKVDINFTEKIFSISPNPITNISTIKYSLDIPVQIKLTLLNSLGEEIAILDDGFKDTGEQTLNFSAEEYNLPDGLYFVRLVTGDRVYNEKMIVIK